MKKDKTVYEISVEDIQEVAFELLDRELTAKEVRLVTEKVGDFIPWYDAIENAIIYSEIKKKKKK